jgi:hypothetical protein
MPGLQGMLAGFMRGKQEEIAKRKELERQREEHKMDTAQDNKDYRVS